MKNKASYVFVAIVLVVFAAMIAGFFVIGSPAKQRDKKLDQERINNLYSIQDYIVNYWDLHEELPADLAELQEEYPYVRDMKDPLTKEPYEYNKVGELAFELCATFALATEEQNGSYAYPRYFRNYVEGDSWEHGEGRTCFERKIDLDEYRREKANRPEALKYTEPPYPVY